MAGISPPNFTSVPNEILDTMADMEESELRVVLAICRKTFGWHKVRDRLSLTQLEKLTGLSRTAVHAGITAAMTRGTVERVRCGKQGFEYRILVASSYQSTEATSSFKLPEPDHSDYRQLVASDYTQKKDVKQKTNDVVSALIDLGLERSQASGIAKDQPALTVDNLAQWPEYLGRKKLGVGFLIKQLRSGQLVPPPERTFSANGNGSPSANGGLRRAPDGGKIRPDGRYIQPDGLRLDEERNFRMPDGSPWQPPTKEQLREWGAFQ